MSALSAGMRKAKTAPSIGKKRIPRTGFTYPPRLTWRAMAPLAICEGEKKTLALNQAGIPAVGIGGVWNWCQKGEGYKKPKESRPIPDLDLVNWRRPVTIIFDSDGHDNPLVRLAAFRLARELSRRGAAVSILFLPPCPHGREARGG